MPKPRNASFAVIVHNKKILLFLRDNSPNIPYPNCWQLPGGQIEKGESPLTALKRELVEEVSYCPKNIDSIGYIVKESSAKYYLFISFVEDKEAKKFKHSGDEGVAINFFLLDELENIPLVASLLQYKGLYRPIIEKVFKDQKAPKAEELGLIPFRPSFMYN